MHPDDDLHTLVRGGLAGHGVRRQPRRTSISRSCDRATICVGGRAARRALEGQLVHGLHLPHHAGRPLPLKTFDAIPEAIQQGFPSFKVFTTDVLPPHPKRPSNRLDFGRLQYAMEKVAPRGGIMVVHAEDHDVVQFMYERFRRKAAWTERTCRSCTTRSPRAVVPARDQPAAIMDAAIYFVHTSAREGVERWPRRAGWAGRSTPRRCTTTRASRPTTTARRAFLLPHLSVAEVSGGSAALWDGCQRRGVDHGHDEYPTTLALKLRGKTIEDVTAATSRRGAHGHRLYEGVVKRKMSLERFVQVTSSNAAKILASTRARARWRPAATPTSC